MNTFPPTLRRRALLPLLTRDPDQKAALTRALPSHELAQGQADEADAGTPVGADERLAEERGGEPGIPGRPDRPELVAPARVKQRSVQSPEGRAALLHALAHIELNAIDLALDLVWRFAGLPDDFYRQWIAVAREEARHFELLHEHLRGMGHGYGDFPAHNGLWEMAEKTRGDLLARIALVPRTLEARGLDAAPPIREKLLRAGDERGAAILALILREEIGHVAVGNHWYRWLCAQRGLDPINTYELLARRHGAPRLRGPFNLPARRAAGFDDEELAWLQRSTE